MTGGREDVQCRGGKEAEEEGAASGVQSCVLPDELSVCRHRRHFTCYQLEELVSIEVGGLFIQLITHIVLNRMRKGFKCYCEIHNLLFFKCKKKN